MIVAAQRALVCDNLPRGGLVVQAIDSDSIPKCGFRGRRTLVSVKSNKLEGGAARCMDCSVSVRDQATPSSGLFFRRIESPFSGSLWA